MKFEIAIKATESEIKRLEKRNQAIQSNVNEYCNYSDLTNRIMDFAYKKSQVEARIDFHTNGFDRLKPAELAACKTVLAEVNKELARLKKLSLLNTAKEYAKQIDITKKLDNLRDDLIQLRLIASKVNHPTIAEIRNY